MDRRCHIDASFSGCCGDPISGERIRIESIVFLGRLAIAPGIECAE